MRFRPVLGSITASIVLSFAVLAACSSSDSTTTATDSGTNGPSSSSSSSGSTGVDPVDASDAADAADASKMPTSTDCSLVAIAAIPDVTPTFVVTSATNMPPTQTGGTLSGTYTVDTATVYLPSAVALFGTPMGSGTINSWAEFKGTRYLLHLDVNLMVTAGSQSLPITNNEDSQGGFTTAASALTLDYACDTTQPEKADFTYTDDGTGRATILVHTTTVYDGLTLDGYLLLGAAKAP